jgi:16S rRNA (guanine527-N7)-methyltransferase
VGAADDSSSPVILRDILSDARTAGFLGPDPVELHLAHADGFAAAARSLQRRGEHAPRLIDLGSGGGVPGLVVADHWPAATVTLLEANRRRAAFLRRAVERLGVGRRVSVVAARAEVCGRDPEFRGRFDGVVARCFGRPAVVAECAAPLLRLGGWVVVSEPPPDPAGGPPDPADPAAHGSRWPADPLRQVGLEPLGVVSEGFDFMTLRQVEPCPDRFPRRDGVPAKRPLF